MNAQDCKKNQVNKILKVNAWGPYLPKAYNDTWSDMSHTTCWIRQNLWMSDRVSPPKTPSDNVVEKIGRVQFSSNSIQPC